MDRVRLLILAFAVCIAACTNIQPVAEQEGSKTIRDLHLEARKGNAKAELALGYLYYQGKDVEKDFEEASRWFGLAASHGITEAVPDLRNTPHKENPKSLMWFRLAAARGDLRAQRELGRYYSGAQGLTIGTGQDNLRSYMWYKILSTYQAASPDIALLVDVIGQRLTPNERLQGEDMAKACLSRLKKGCD